MLVVLLNGAVALEAVLWQKLMLQTVVGALYMAAQAAVLEVDLLAFLGTVETAE